MGSKIRMKLVELLGIIFRMIQTYEQGDQDILRAESKDGFCFGEGTGVCG